MNRCVKKIPVLATVALCVLGSCDLFTYGRLGGADQTDTLRPADPGFDTVMDGMSGLWYSHYAGIGRLDGYRIGKWEDFPEMVEHSGKAALFPVMEKKTYTAESGNDIPDNEDFFVFYDDTVYGQADDGVDGNGGNGGWGFDYIGIVRAVNIFNGDSGRGALIIEYLKGCAPPWLNRWPDSSDGKRPFFGIYFRILDRDTVQMANAVDLAALYAGKKYYTETEHFDDAIALNTVENEAEFISWGVVIPQDRETR
jgi:hypothetical protein